MTTGESSFPWTGLKLDPADLDGHSIEELSDYLDSDRTPPDPSIEQSAACQLALDALARLRSAAPELLHDQETREPPADEGWMSQIMAWISQDARPGRRLPFASEDPDADLGITEGAVRGIVRSAEQAVPGIVVGRCRLIGEVTTPAAPVRVQIDVTVAYGRPLPLATQELRRAVLARLASETELNVTGVDIIVHDVWLPIERMENPA